MVKLKKRVAGIIFGGILLSFAIFCGLRRVVEPESLIFHREEIHNNTRTRDGGVKRDDELKNTAIREKSTKVITHEDDHETTPNRATAVGAFNYMIKCMNSLDFEQFYDCFSPEGKLALTEGKMLDSDDMAKMNIAFKRSGCRDTRVLSMDISELPDEDRIVAAVESRRSGVVKHERLRISLVMVSNAWLVKSYSVEPISDRK